HPSSSVGRVECASYGDGSPLLFHGGGYGRVAGSAGVFSALPEELLKPILAAGVERGYEDGETIMRVGEPGDFMALMLQGTVRVERPGKTVRLTTGDVVGEIAVLDGGPRSADGLAQGAVR